MRPPASPASELVPPPSQGRVFRWPARVRIGDAAPSGRARLDAIAGWLQDAAFADIVDAGLHHPSRVWIVRRARIRVERFPGFDEGLSVETFASGLGTLWAERRTTVHGERGGHVEAVAVWVHIDAGSARPSPVGDEFLEVYGPAADGRRVRARLRHPPPPADATSRPWVFRAAELDIAGHVNNASYWQIVEEELIPTLPADLVDFEIEHRAPAGAGSVRVLGGDAYRWVVGGDGELHASIALG